MRALIAALALTVWAPPVAAFHRADTFSAPALDGGGGSLPYTGSPRARGYDCAVCHADASGVIRVALASDPPELAADHRYEPGRTYRITVALTGLHRGLGALADRNGFALEVLDDDDRAAGALAAIDPDVTVLDDGVALPTDASVGASVWSVSWTAPAAGPVHLYVAGVDGDGGGSDATGGADPYGDDAWSGVLGADVAVAGVAAAVAPAEPGFAAQGCRQAGDGDARFWALPPVLAVLSRRRRYRSGPGSRPTGRTRSRDRRTL